MGKSDVAERDSKVAITRARSRRWPLRHHVISYLDIRDGVQLMEAVPACERILLTVPTIDISQ